MLETIGNLFSNVALYVAALLGLIAAYFLWIAFREWRVSQRAAFGIERDIASSEMVGAVLRAVALVILALVIFGLGQLAGQEEPSEQASVEPTQTPMPTVSVFRTPTPGSGEPAPTLLPTDAPASAVTDVPPLPVEATQAPAVAPTPETAQVSAFGGVWLRDAPNGGTIDVLPQGTVVEFMEGREFAGSYDWQRVRVLNTPPGSEALVDLDGWVAADFLEANP